MVSQRQQGDDMNNLKTQVRVYGCGQFRLAPIGMAPMGYIYWMPREWEDFGGWGIGIVMGIRTPKYWSHPLHVIWDRV